VPCKSCGSVTQSKFIAEMGIHVPGLKNIDKLVVWVFPELVVCLDCGTAEFAVPEAELRQLAKGDAATPRATAIKRAKVSRKTASSE
jgi:Zn ribbon nucleic-acid-binding protein